VHTQIRGADTARRLLNAATRLKPLDTAMARDTLLEAAGAAIFAGRLGHGAHEVARAARACPAAPRPNRVTDTLLDAVTGWILDGHSASADAIRHALQAARREQTTEHGGDPAGWLLLSSPLTPEPLAPEVWDDDAWHDLATGATDLARRAGALSVLPLALTHQACYRVHAGELDTAAMLIDEAAAVSQVTGSTPLLYTSLLLHAWQAAEQQVLDTIDHGIQDVLARGEGRALAIADYASAVLYNGLGRYETALAAALRACEHEDMGIFGWALSELVEVAARAGQRDTAQQALERLTPRTRASATAWAAGIEARCRGHGCRRAVPGVDRATRTHPDQHPVGACAPALRRMAAPAPAPAGEPDAAAHRVRGVHAGRRRRVRRPGPPGADRDRGDRTQAQRQPAGRADRPGGRDRQARPRRAHQPRDRRPAVHQPPHRRVASGQRVHQTGGQLPPPPARCAADRRVAGHRLTLRAPPK
jgi:tetratricopeptide (TPR) repeat protein